MSARAPVYKRKASRDGADAMEGRGMLAVVVLLGVLAGAYGNTYRMGGCPKVVVMKGLDFDKFLGEWYVVRRFNPMATCTKLGIDKNDEGQYFVNETSRPFGINFGYFHSIDGYRQARKLKFLRDDTNSIFRIQRPLAHVGLSTFGIVDTDYDNYAIVWGCDPVIFGSVQNVDVLSRRPEVDSETLPVIEENLKKMDVDIHPMGVVNQAQCIESKPDVNGKDPHNMDTNNMSVEKR